MKNKKSILSFLLALVFIFNGFINKVEVASADNNFITYLWCMSDFGQTVYNGAKSGKPTFELRSKSAMVQNKNETVSDNLYNKMMEVGGYNFGELGKTPFNKFGFAGLNISSYAGEWKYVYVDACIDNEGADGVSNDYGHYYDKRYEPQATHSEIRTSDDVRTQQFNWGFLGTLHNVNRDGIANVFLTIVKLVTSITITLIGLAFGDVASFAGIGTNTMSKIFSNLYQGVFQPFTVMMFVITALYMMYYGLMKRQYRQALNELGKSILVLLVAIVLSANPRFLMIPNTVATMGQALIISAMTQENVPANDLCGVNETTIGGDPEAGKNITSVEDTNSFLKDLADETRTVVGCRMWAEFVFRPWVSIQWNAKYEDLKDIGNSEQNREWVGEPDVDLGNGVTKRNWALFQISTQTDQHVPVDGSPRPLISGIHPDWWRIVDATSNINYTVIKRIDAAEAARLSRGSGTPSADYGDNPDKEAVIEAIWDYFRDVGYTDEGIAGMLGNIEVESGGTFDPGVKEYENNQSYSERGIGLIQWTYPPRQQGLKDLAASKGKDWTDLGVQLEYLHYELSTSYTEVHNTLMTSNNARTAANIFCNKFEVPVSCAGRADNADKYLNNKPSGSSNKNKSSKNNSKKSSSSNSKSKTSSGSNRNPSFASPSSVSSYMNKVKNFKINAIDPPEVDGKWIDDYLAKKYPASRLNGYGDEIKKKADEYGVSVVAFLGQIKKETSMGSVDCGGAKYNFGCIVWSEESEYPNSGQRILDRYWIDPPTVEEGIESYMKLVRNNYIDKGFSEYPKYLERYSPGFENNHESFAQHLYIVGEELGVNWDETEVKTPGAPSNDGGSGIQVNEGEIVELKLPVEPTKYWNYWIGNEGSRISNTFLAVVLALLGSITPLIFALLTAIYSVGINLLMSVAPIFLIFGMWPNRGMSIFKSWFATLLSTITKKLLASFLLLISIIINTKLMSMISDFGYVKSIIIMGLITLVLYKNKDEIIDRLSQINLPGQSNLNIDGIFRNSTNIVKDKSKQVAEFTGETLAVSALGAKEMIKSEGLEGDTVTEKLKNLNLKNLNKNAWAGAKSAGGEYIMDKAYASNNPALRMSAIKGGQKNTEGEDINRICDECGQLIKPGTMTFRNRKGDMICEFCHNSGEFDEYDIENIASTNNSKVNGPTCDKCGGDLFAYGEVKESVSGHKYCGKCHSLDQYDENGLNELRLTKEEMEYITPENFEEIKENQLEKYKDDQQFVDKWKEKELKDKEVKKAIIKENKAKERKKYKAMTREEKKTYNRRKKISKNFPDYDPEFVEETLSKEGRQKRKEEKIKDAEYIRNKNQRERNSVQRKLELEKERKRKEEKDND